VCFFHKSTTRALGFVNSHALDLVSHAYKSDFAFLYKNERVWNTSLSSWPVRLTQKLYFCFKWIPNQRLRWQWHRYLLEKSKTTAGIRILARLIEFRNLTCGTQVGSGIIRLLVNDKFLKKIQGEILDRFLYIKS